MGRLTEFELGQRRALVEKVYCALERAKITPYQLSVIGLQKLLEPTRCYVVFGPEIVAALYSVNFLTPIESAREDLEVPGWLHKVVIRESDRCRLGKILRTHTITEYYVRENGKAPCGTKGELFLRARSENGIINLGKWRCRWGSDMSSFPLLPERTIISSEAFILFNVLQLRQPGYRELLVTG